MRNECHVWEATLEVEHIRTQTIPVWGHLPPPEAQISLHTGCERGKTQPWIMTWAWKMASTTSAHIPLARTQLGNII